MNPSNSSHHEGNTKNIQRKSMVGAPVEFMEIFKSRKERGGHRAENEELGWLPLVGLHPRWLLNLLFANYLVATNSQSVFVDGQCGEGKRRDFLSFWRSFKYFRWISRFFFVSFQNISYLEWITVSRFFAALWSDFSSLRLKVEPLPPSALIFDEASFSKVELS